MTKDTKKRETRSLSVLHKRDSNSGESDGEVVLSAGRKALAIPTEIVVWLADKKKFRGS